MVSFTLHETYNSCKFARRGPIKPLQSNVFLNVAQGATKLNQLYICHSSGNYQNTTYYKVLQGPTWKSKGTILDHLAIYRKLGFWHVAITFYMQRMTNNQVLCNKFVFCTLANLNIPLYRILDGFCKILGLYAFNVCFFHFRPITGGTYFLKLEFFFAKSCQGGN